MRSTEQRARRAEKERERRAAESPACRQARLASDKASTRRRRQALTLESDITAKRRNSEKKQRARRAEKERERRAAESPACRQARLASVKASTRRRRQALTLESDITAKRRNSVKKSKRERRAAESPAARLARLATKKAATRKHRQALKCEKGLRPFVFSPPGKQLNVPQPGFSPLLYAEQIIRLDGLFVGGQMSTLLTTTWRTPRGSLLISKRAQVPGCHHHRSYEWYDR